MLITVVGKICRLAVFITVNRSISALGTGALPFSSSIPFMAAIPAGVAALPAPNIFAIMFMVILSFWRVFGKSLPITGDNSLSHALAAPPFSAIRRMPDQKHIVPASEMMTETASLAPDTPLSRTVSGAPENRDKTSETRIIKVQTAFISVINYSLKK